MNYRFVLGIGRSGTTLLGKLVALTNSKVRSVIEPLPRLKSVPVNGYNEPWTVLPYPGSDEVNTLRETIVKLSKTTEMIRTDLIKETVEIDDPAFDFLLIKEVHGLLAFPFALDTLDYKAVVITRDITKTVDSILFNHPNYKYLLDEYDFIRSCLRSPAMDVPQMLGETIKTIPPKVVRHIVHNVFESDLILGQTCINSLINNYLRAWAISQPNQVRHIEYETLCINPEDEMKKIFEFLEFSFDASTMQKVYSMTHSGSDKGPYDTNKDSLQILNQDYKFLEKHDLKNIQDLFKA